MLKQLIKKHISNTIPQNEKVAVMFSGGLDSLSVLFSLIELGYDVKLYTFYREGVLSDDLKISRKVASNLNLELEEIEISNDLDKLVDDLKLLIKKHDLKKKTQFQVMHPMVYVCNAITEKFVVSGLAADTLYGTARSMLKFASNEVQFREKREELIYKEESDSYKFIKDELTSLNKIFIVPYKESKEIIDYFLKLTPKDLYSGKQKKQTYNAFKEEIDKLHLYRRNSSMQINSGIRELHDELLKTNWNTKGFKSVVGVYNQIIKYVKESDEFQRRRL